jgi:S-DNA-T family DNA segregation ATPase FtsK/SpoIIIE
LLAKLPNPSTLRIGALRRAIVDSPVAVGLHRAKVFTRVYKAHADEPWIVRKALSLREYFETVPLYLREHDGIAGSISEAPGAMPVIVELDKVVAALQWVTREMDGRYRKFAEMGARNIADYNRRANAKSKVKLPYIVVVIDELADLMLMAPDETERTVCRLAQMARATGIHLIIATQRPSVDVVTGLIKANFPSRVAFAVASSTDSRVILDTTGAERLLGQGDMLWMSSDSPQPLRMQGCFVSDKELQRLVDFWRRQRLAAVQAGRAARGDISQPPAASADVPDAADAEPGFESDPDLVPTPAPAPTLDPPLQQPLWEEVLELEKQAAEQDELFDEAVTIVSELGKASVSLLQRRLRIGYTRAARLIDDMEARGVVGPHPGGSRQREVLVPAPTTLDDADSAS